MKRMLILILPLVMLTACNRTPGNSPATSAAQEPSVKAETPAAEVAVADMNDDQLINLVKTSVLDEIGDKSITIGQALDGYPHFSYPGEWTVVTSEQGRKIVRFVGIINLPEKSWIKSRGSDMPVGGELLIIMAFTVNLDRSITFGGSYLTCRNGQNDGIEGDPLSLKGVQRLWNGEIVGYWTH